MAWSVSLVCSLDCFCGLLAGRLVDRLAGRRSAARFAFVHVCFHFLVAGVIVVVVVVDGCGCAVDSFDVVALSMCCRRWWMLWPVVAGRGCCL